MLLDFGRLVSFHYLKSALVSSVNRYPPSRSPNARAEGLSKVQPWMVYSFTANRNFRVRNICFLYVYAVYTIYITSFITMSAVKYHIIIPFICLRFSCNGRLWPIFLYLAIVECIVWFLFRVSSLDILCTILIWLMIGTGSLGFEVLSILCGVL